MSEEKENGVQLAPDDDAREEPGATIVEEGIPPADSGKSTSIRNRLSAVSRKYDIDGDGKLDETEQAMRDMDIENKGFLSNEMVYKLMREQMQTQKDLLNAKRLVLFFGGFALLLAVATIGTSFAAAKLAQETTTSNNVLVVKGTDEVVATGHQGKLYHIVTMEDSSRRQLANFTVVATIPEDDLDRMKQQCDASESVNIIRTWDGYDAEEAIPVCPGNGHGKSQGVYKFHLYNGRTLEVDCRGPGDCDVGGTGFLLSVGDFCTQDADCLFNTCSGTPGTCFCPRPPADTSSCSSGLLASCIYGNSACDYDNSCIANLAAADAGIAWDHCVEVMFGRPFVDGEGAHLQATVVDTNSTSTSWSTSSYSDSHQLSETLAITNREQDACRHSLGQEWTGRALGEHASVASFAAFTLALMSNNAPPDLVRDSLIAGLDEVRHAETSFAVASSLMGQSVEPGPLPPSTLEFGNDLTAMAIATAREGCVDETLSALDLAAEANEYEDGKDDFVSELNLKDKTTTIALEEATHSALAWRTIRWVCRVDPSACSAVQKEVLEPSKLKAAYERRFPSSASLNFENEWTEIYEALLPLLENEAQNHCNTKIKGVEPQDLVSMVVNKIITGVMCPNNDSEQLPTPVNHAPVHQQNALECEAEAAVERFVGALVSAHS